MKLLLIVEPVIHLWRFRERLSSDGDLILGVPANERQSIDRATGQSIKQMRTMVSLGPCGCWGIHLPQLHPAIPRMIASISLHKFKENFGIPSHK